MKKLALLVLLAGCTMPIWGQSVELAVGAGGYFPINNTLSPGKAVAIQGTGSVRLISLPLASLYFDLPVVGTLHSGIPALRQLTSRATYSSLFLAPGLKVKLAPSFPVSPFLAAGFGWARYQKSAAATPAGTSKTTSTNVFDVGGGLDMKVAPFFSVRGEFRDFYSGNAHLRLSNFDQRQHNLVATISLVLRL